MLSTNPSRAIQLALSFYAAILATLVVLPLLAILPSNAGLAQSAVQGQSAPDSAPQYQPLNQQPAQRRPASATAGPPPAEIAGSTAGATDAPGILASTTQHIDGYHVRRYLGVVRGVRVFQPTIGESFRAGLKGIIGGNIGAYTEMCEKARQQAYDQLIERSTALGANAVLGLHYDSSSFGMGGSEMGTEVICYGTAVFLEADR